MATVGPNTPIEWPIASAAIQDVLLDGLNVEVVQSYRWIAVLGGLLAFAMAWGIGANDVANAFATSVGSGALTLRWAIAIAAVCELAGAVLLGNNVTDTVRKKIINPDVFDPVQGGAANGPELLMTAFLTSLLSATTWLIIATYMSLPVSTTHSIIGALVGTALVYGGKDAVIWISSGSGFNRLKGLVGVILSWFISPILSAIFAVALFLIVRTLVFRTKNPVRNGFIFLPLFYGFTVAIACFFIIYKGSPRLGLSKKLSVGEATAISLGAGAGVAILSYFIILPLAKKYIDAWEVREAEKLKDPEAHAPREHKIGGKLQKVGFNIDLDEELGDDIVALHENVEKFDPKAEQLFSWLQVFTAAFDSFAHGANDVANAVAPFASIYQLFRDDGRISGPKTEEFEDDITLVLGGEEKSFEKGDDRPDGEAFCGKIGDDKFYRCVEAFPSTGNAFPASAKAENFSLVSENEDTGEITADATTTLCHTECVPGGFAAYDSDKKPVEIWILVLGGVGIVLGLAMWGYRIISAIGQRLTKLTPSRGFSIEVGAAITVIIASRIGLPVSTTHCQVGATVGVGLAEFKANTVNWKQFLFICIGWVFTVLFTGALSAAIYALLIYSPRAYDNESETLQICPGERMFYYDEAEEKFRGISCSGR